MGKQELLNIIRYDNDLLSMPQVIAELLNLTEQEDFSTKTLSKIIKKDPSITGRVLRLANSPAYRGNQPISDISMAISKLGSTTVRCLALSSSLFHSQTTNKISGLNYKDLMEFTFYTASACESIANLTRYNTPQEALITGLLHDIGIIFFLHHSPENYKQVNELMDSGVPLILAERQVYGIDHAEIGFHIAKSWNLPEKIALAIQNHHNTTEIKKDDPQLVNILKLAVLIPFGRFSGYDINIEERLAKIELLAAAHGFDYEKVTLINNGLFSRAVEISNGLDVEIDNTECLLTKANKEIWNSYFAIDRLFKEREGLNRKLLIKERNNAAMEAKDKALATLSHYLNNAVMVISGQFQILNMLRNNNKSQELIDQLPSSFDKVTSSISKILAVMEELREISPLDYTDFFHKSEAMNIDSRLELRIKRISAEFSVNARNQL